MHLLFKILVVSVVFVTANAEMNCQWYKDQGILQQMISTCPGLTDSSDKGYCCFDQHGNHYCCTLIEFALTYIIIGVVALVVISLVCCIVSCLCCPCCFCYKRRAGHPI